MQSRTTHKAPNWKMTDYMFKKYLIENITQEGGLIPSTSKESPC